MSGKCQECQQNSYCQNSGCPDEALPKLNSKTLLHKNKTSINLCAKICGYQKKSKKSKFLEWGTSKEKIARKRYLRKYKSSHVNFQWQESGLFISQAYTYLGATPDGVISCNCCGEGVLERKCPGLVEKG